MTNLIAKVAELRKLEAKATPGPWDMNYNGSYEIFTAGHGPSESRDKTVMRWKDDGLPIRGKDSLLILIMRNAAPRMLAALGKVQAGDAHKLDEIIEMIDFSIPSELMSVEESDEDFDIAPSEYQEMIQMKATLQRYVDLARLMEGNP